MPKYKSKYKTYLRKGTNFKDDELNLISVEKKRKKISHEESLCRRAIFRSMKILKMPRSSMENVQTDVQPISAGISNASMEEFLSGNLSGSLSEESVQEESTSAVAIDRSPTVNIDAAESMTPAMPAQSLTEIEEPNANKEDLEHLDYAMAILMYSMRHKLTDRGICDLIKMINFVIGKKILPESYNMFLKQFGPCVNDFQINYYCGFCKNAEIVVHGSIYSKEKPVCACGKKLHDFFIIFNIKPLLRNILESNEACLFFKDTDSGDTSLMKDIFDGLLYQNLKKSMRKYDFSYNLSTDGAPLYKSNNIQIWPMFMSINELKPKCRFQNIVTIGFWATPQQIMPFNIYMERIIEKLTLLQEGGVSWNYKGNIITSRLFPLIVIADAPARAKLQNIVSHSGYYACHWCLQHGEVINGAVRYPVNDELPAYRTEKSMREHAAIVHTSSRNSHKTTTTFGVKDLSPLIKLKHFHIVQGFGVDYMHGILIGVTKTLMDLWLTKCTKEFYIGKPSSKRKIDDRLLSIKPPSTISRYPRSVTEIKNWKANEYQNFLLYYSFPCLKGILNSQYLDHFLVLRNVVYMLLEKEIKEEMVNKAEYMIEEFILQYQYLYGRDNMSYNCHILSHLIESVRRIGPLWTFSSFPYENALRLLRQHLTGSMKTPALQLARRTNLQGQINLKNVTNKTRKFCDELKLIKKNEDQKPQFVQIPLELLTEFERNALAPYSSPEVVNVHKSINCKLFRLATCPNKKHDDSNVILDDGVFAKVKKIVSFQSTGIKEAIQLVILQKYIPGKSVGYMSMDGCCLDQNLFGCSLERIQRTCVKIDMNDKYFLVPLNGAFAY